MNNLTLYRNRSPLFNLFERGKRSVESAAISRALLSDDTLTIRMKSSSVLDIKINDYFVLFGSIYRLNILPNINKISDAEYEYDIIAQGLMYDMLRCKYFDADGNGQKFNLEFPLIGTIETFLICLKNNMRRLSLDWEIGNFTNAETKTITFGDDSCLSALQKICDEFKVDFWVKIENEKIVIHTGDFGRKLPINFEYGKGKGLYSLNRSNVDDNDIINRLYVLGGTENIPNGYRNFSMNLMLPTADFIEDTNLVAGFGLKEGSITFDDIYPKRTGKVTALGSTKFKFIDSGMDFDLNAKEADNVTTKYLIAGTSAKIHFNTGNLAGYEFEIKKGGYSHASKEFEIIPFTNDSGQKFPDVDSEAFQFALGDEYVILDIVMPQTYIDNAENELLVKGLEQFELHKNAKVSYDLEIDPAYMEKIGIGNFDIGDYVTVVDKPLGINKMLRINSTTVNFIENGVYNPFRYKVTIADSYEINYASQVILDIKTIKNVLSITNLGNINYSKLGLKTTQELQNLTFDTDGYFDPLNIKPESIETNMLSVGAKSQQVSCSVVFELMVDGDKNKVKANTGVIYSQTFDKTWNIAENNVTLPDDGFRYVYAVCNKSGTDAVIEFNQDKIKFDDNVNDFYFLLGVLHSVVDDVRVLSITIGTTTINGGLIRTGIISSLDMQTYFNLDSGEIKGKIKFLNGSDGFTSIDGGVIVSESVLVGDSEGVNGGITGLEEGSLGNNSVALWFGSGYNGRKTAPFRVTRNGQVALESKDGMNVVKGLYLEEGQIIWRDENGIIRRIINMFLDQRFSGNGTLLYEVNETGFHSYAVPQSFLQVSIASLSGESEIQTDSELQDILLSNLTVEISGNNGKYSHKRKLLPNMNAFKYLPGNVDSSNLVYEGYKSSNTDKTLNIPNGWYSTTIGQFINSLSTSPFTTYDVTIPMLYIKNGKITQTRTITVNV